MLRYPYFCRVYKNFLSCSMGSCILNVGTWPKEMPAAARKYTEHEAQRQMPHPGVQDLHKSGGRVSEAMTQLHVPVMVDEVVHCLAPQKGQIFLDMTFGSGGHSRAILQEESDIILYALDRDPAAYAIAEQLSELYPNQIRPMLGLFSKAEALLVKSGVQPGTLDGVLLDLGCSSMQLDAPERGFSLRKDGPLDMRMDGGRYPDMPTAADVVNALDPQALASILRAYGEEKHAKKIASAIVQARSIYPITRTQQLASIVAELILHVCNLFQTFVHVLREQCAGFLSGESSVPSSYPEKAVFCVFKRRGCAAIIIAGASLVFMFMLLKGFFFFYVFADEGGNLNLETYYN